MKIEEKFNKRAPNLVTVQMPSVHAGPQYAEGIKLTFYRDASDPDRSTIAMHLTPYEALQMAEDLINAARRRLDIQ